MAGIYHIRRSQCDLRSCIPTDRVAGLYHTGEATPASLLLYQFAALHNSLCPRMDNTTTRLESEKVNGGATGESVLPEDDNTMSGSATDNDVAVERMENGGITPQEKALAPDLEASDWEKDPENPYNWPAAKKWHQVAMCASFGFLG